MNKIIAGAAALTFAVTGAVFAGGHAGNPAVSARQAHMELYQHNAGYFFGLARGRVEYNAEAAQAAADNLLALATMSQARYWPAETDSMSIDNTRAMPGLWENFPKVMGYATQLAEGAEALALVASNGKDAALGALGPIGQACSGCHEDFREPRN